MTSLCLLPLTHVCQGCTSPRALPEWHSFKADLFRVPPLWEQRLCAQRTLCLKFLSADPETLLWRRPPRKEVGNQFRHRKPEAYTDTFQPSSFQQDEPGKLIPRYVLHSWQSSNYHHNVNDISNLYLHKNVFLL